MMVPSIFHPAGMVMVSASMLLKEGSVTGAVVNVVGKAEAAAAPEEDEVAPEADEDEETGVGEDDVAEDLQAASARTRSMEGPKVVRLMMDLLKTVRLCDRRSYHRKG
jgi:hypothetical protein